MALSTFTLSYSHQHHRPLRNFPPSPTEALSPLIAHRPPPAPTARLPGSVHLSPRGCCARGHTRPVLCRLLPLGTVAWGCLLAPTPLFLHQRTLSSPHCLLHPASAVARKSFLRGLRPVRRLQLAAQLSPRRAPLRRLGCPVSSARAVCGPRFRLRRPRETSCGWGTPSR